MAHVILILSGLADDPVEALDGRTPLQAAAKPALDQLSAMAEVGLVRPLPERPEDDPSIGADRTTLALFGHDNVFTGRGVLELLGAKAPLDGRDSGVRFDLISTARGLDPFPTPPPPEDAAQLWEDLAKVCTRADLTIRGVTPLKGLGVWREGPVEVAVRPPGELTDEELDEQLPEGDREDDIRRLINDAREVLASHPVNRRREEAEQPTYDALWPWGFGRAPDLKLFVLRTGQVVTLLAGSLAVAGAGRATGVTVLRSPEGPSGMPERLASGIPSALERCPNVVAHCPLADLAAHTGDLKRKQQAIEAIDAQLVKPLLELLETDRRLDLTVVTDYACCAETRRHANRPVPYLAYRHDRTETGPSCWCENESAEAGRLREGARDLLGWLWRS